MTQNVGSYLLRDLHDQALPEAISWLPQTIGWQFFAIVLTGLFVRYCYIAMRRYWQNRYRREAIQALQQLDLSDPSVAVNRMLTITNVVIRYAFPGKQYAKARSSDNTVQLSHFLVMTTQHPMNETLLKEWFSALLHPEQATQWTSTKALKLQQELACWFATHHTTGGEGTHGKH